MSQGDINVAKTKNAKKSRRRKKRRTADVSDSSDSDSSSSDNEMQIDTTNKGAEQPTEEQQPIGQLSDIELSDDESGKKNNDNDENLNDETKENLTNIPFTTTELTQTFAHNKYDSANTIDLKKVNETLTDANTKLNTLIDEKTKAINSNLQNEYLGILFQNYGDDINSLRNAPDFTNKSLVLLANVLKDGSKMFDVDTLKTIVESK